MNKRTVDLIIALGAGAAIAFPQMSYARDLISAGTSTANTIKSVAQVLAVTGVIGGGAIMQLPGAGEWGRRVMATGFVGCLCAYGAPAFKAMMTSVFGGL